MRLTISLAASLALAALLLAACNPQDSSAPAANSAATKQPAASPAAQKAGPTADATPPAAQQQQQQPAGEVRRITIEQARAEAEAGRAVFFDVRNAQAFETAHIKGAKLVPYDEVEQHLGDFPKDKLIITYCA